MDEISPIGRKTFLKNQPIFALLNKELELIFITGKK